MKLNKINTYLVAGATFLLVMMGQGCAKISDFGNTNVNPNQSTYASTASFLSGIETRLGNNNFSTTTGGNSPSLEILSGLLAQYFAEPTYPGAQNYAASYLQVNFGGVYSGILKDIQTIIDRNTNAATMADAKNYGANESQIAIARILKAYVYWNVTDKWGDIPYSEALKGVAVPTPKYDKQEFIYKDLLKELTEAVAQFKGTNDVQGDLIYSGNETKWKKLANSLRMLISLRTSKLYPGVTDYAATQFKAAATDVVNGYITSNSDNFSIYYPGNANPYNNPYYGPGNSNDNAVSLTLTDLLNGLGDTRLSVFSTNGTGVAYGLDVPVPTTANNAKILAASFKAAAGTVVIVGAGQVLLASAEGYERGWISGIPDPASAKTAYEAGVTANFARWGLTIPPSYLTTGPANYTSGAGVASIGGATVPGSNALTPTGLKRIQLQQYIAYYPDGAQAWANWRRTGVPDLKPSTKATGPIPRRFTYGPTEYSLNLTQVTAAAAAMGGDTKDVRVWWDL
jgi:hypothetical protein